MSDYLWDKSGPGDDDLRQLETLLAPLAHRQRPPVLPAAVPSRVSWWPLIAAAAVVLLALVVTSRHVVPAAAGSWRVAWLEGPSWERATSAGEGEVAAGQQLDTGDRRARLAVGAIGEVQLEPGTTVRLLDTGERQHRLSLARGRMHATIWAPPGQFVVDTPSAVAVDLGCRYTLAVGADGSGRLSVEAGWVGIEHGARLALVPAGAVANTRPGSGPGTPHYEDASAAFSRALDVLDFSEDAGARTRALADALAEARARDALSVWHLLTRTSGSARTQVYERLTVLVPPPHGVTRDGVLAGDRTMLEAWWGELGLGSAEFWKTWTTSWRHASGTHGTDPAPRAAR